MSCYSVRLLKFTTNACFNLLPHCSGIQDKLPALFIWVVSLGKTDDLYNSSYTFYVMFYFWVKRKCSVLEWHLQIKISTFTVYFFLFVEIIVRGSAIKSEMIRQTCTPAAVVQRPGGFQPVKLEKWWVFPLWGVCLLLQLQDGQLTGI